MLRVATPVGGSLLFLSLLFLSCAKGFDRNDTNNEMDNDINNAHAMKHNNNSNNINTDNIINNNCNSNMSVNRLSDYPFQPPPKQ